MPFVQHKMSSLVIIDPKAAKAAIITAFRKAKASRQGAAQLLGVHVTTLVNWAGKLGIREQLAELEKKAEKEGWHHGRNRLGGRPPKSDEPE